jgi:hypothetical protein
MRAPAVLTRSGWKRSSVKIADVITIDGTLAKDGANHGNARSVTMTETGEKLGPDPAKARHLSAKLSIQEIYANPLCQCCRGFTLSLAFMTATASIVQTSGPSRGRTKSDEPARPSPPGSHPRGVPSQYAKDGNDVTVIMFLDGNTITGAVESGPGCLQAAKRFP